MKYLVILCVVPLAGCANLSSNYSVDSEALNAFHKAKVELEIAKGIFNTAQAHLNNAQRKYDEAKKDLDVIVKD